MLRFLLLYLLFSCVSKTTSVQKSNLDKLNKHPVRQLKFWATKETKPLIDRIDLAPQELIDYLQKENKVKNIKNTPDQIQYTDKHFGKSFNSLIRDTHQAIRGLPEDLRSTLPKVVLGIYFVNNLGGTAYTNTIFDQQEKVVSTFIVLDAEVLMGKTANQWASWRENSAFKPSKNQSFPSVSLKIEESDSDNRVQAIQFILLHELGHSFSIMDQIHPDWNDDMSNEIQKKINLNNYSFLKLSWISMQDHQYRSKFDDKEFINRPKVSFYFNPQLQTKDIPLTYRQLGQTNFASLYGSMNPYEDWAESFAIYVHSVLLKRPYQYQIRTSKRSGFVSTSCLLNQKCDSKRKYLDNFFKKLKLKK